MTTERSFYYYWVMDKIYNKRKIQLADFFNTNKRLPTYSEMTSLFSLKSKNSIFFIVKKFVEEGFLKRDDYGHLVPGNIISGIKILGTVEAGFPSPAEEELADTITLDDYLIRKKEATFILKVSGDSMIGAGIKPGDLVLIEKGRQARHGDIVIAEVDNEWTIKTFEIHQGKIVLVPANPKYQTIRPKESLNIAGVVTAVIRKYR